MDASSERAFTIQNSRGVTWNTVGISESPSVGYARVLPAAGSGPTGGLAIFGFRQDNVLVTEAGVPLTPGIRAGRVYAEAEGPVNTGLAIGNTNDEAVTLSFHLTDLDGKDCFLHRSDLTTEIQDFIRLAEADLQVRAKLSQWDTSATVTLTSGSGSLPNDFAHATSVTYGTGNYTLDFMPQIGFDAYGAAGTSDEPEYYTIRGSNLLVYPLYSGDVTLAYTARFTALSNSSTTNSLLTLFPDVYLHGTLAHACVWTRDSEGAAMYGALFDNGVGRVKKYMRDFMYPDGLQMRAA